MHVPICRRSFLFGSASLAAAAGAGLAVPPLRGALAAFPMTLRIERRTIEVNGRAASVFGIRQPDGTHGLTLEPGEPFRVDLENATGEETIIHWHGQRAPYLQDGVADRNVPVIAPGAVQGYDYRPTPGTHWMHSHHGLFEQALMAAPLVVRGDGDAHADVQEATILLHDFSFREPAEILAGLTGGAPGAHAMHGMSGMAGMDHSGMDMGAAPEASMPAHDLNDVEYDAFLANDRTLRDPFVVRVERGGRVRLRLINGAASTAFWIDLGGLDATLVAVDGNFVEPVAGRRFPMAIAQRLDLIVALPDAGAYPVFAQVEGKRERTGVVLATPEAPIEKLSELADAPAPPVDLSLERRLRAASPLPERAADQSLSIGLTGGMSPYAWSMNGGTWPDVERPVLRAGQRVVMEMRNLTPMAHPMHLHGHHFQVTALNGERIGGALRDTVLVPAMGAVEVAFDADNPGRWPFHCHNLYHRAAGMMTELVYDTHLHPT